MVRFKKRLSWVIRTTAMDGMSQRQFAKVMAENGLTVDPATIGNWLDIHKPNLPDADDLHIIARIRPDISLDWLLGIRPASTVAELFIEQNL